MSILKRIQEHSNVENVDFTSVTEVTGVIKFKKDLNISQILNSKVEEFITFAIVNGKAYIVGFLGPSVICKVMDIEIENLSHKSFTFSVKRDLLKVFNKKEELRLKFEGENIEWRSKFYDGYLHKTIRASNSISEFKKYLNFIINWNSFNSLGKVYSENIRKMHKRLEKVEKSPMSRNIVVGDGYIYAVLPSYVFYKPCNVHETIVVTENIVSNFPKENTEFDIRKSKNMVGFGDLATNIYYIFPEFTTRDLITPYSSLEIGWLGGITKINEVIADLTFHEKTIGLILEFDSNSGIISIEEQASKNKFLGTGKIEHSGKIEMSSVIQDFNDILKIGVIKNKNRNYLKALLFGDESICILQ